MSVRSMAAAVMLLAATVALSGCGAPKECRTIGTDLANTQAKLTACASGDATCLCENAREVIRLCEFGRDECGADAQTKADFEDTIAVVKQIMGDGCPSRSEVVLA